MQQLKVNFILKLRCNICIVRRITIMKLMQPSELRSGKPLIKIDFIYQNECISNSFVNAGSKETIYLDVATLLRITFVFCFYH